MSDKPRIGISACLLGYPVRYNGEGKRDRWVADELGKVVDWTPFCPEMEMGLGTPRPAMRLSRASRNEGVKLVVTNTGEVLTELAQGASRRILPRLGHCDGFILKRSSPSCGIESVKIYGEDGTPFAKSAGVFGEALKTSMPWLPMIEEGRLSDPAQREHFVTRVFATWRLKRVEPEVREIQAFHQAHKLLLMSHHPAHYRALGDIAANREKRPPEEVLCAYRVAFCRAMETPCTRGRRTNALQHVFGYFKDRIDSKERRQVMEVIAAYQAGMVPFIVPVTLLRYLVEKFTVSYLNEQAFFHPYPEDLKVWNLG